MRRGKSQHDIPAFTPSEYPKDIVKNPKSITQTKVLWALSTGRKMSVVDLTTELNISDPRSAIRYLRNDGVPISDVWVNTKFSRYKQYFIHDGSGEE
ncbi:MAG: helix-turn-helix domain-containing protein [Tissierellia bacterium]|nr:helix-turn-helix domain-containing protein [Tissierellia bacterium]